MIDTTTAAKHAQPRHMLNLQDSGWDEAIPQLNLETHANDARTLDDLQFVKEMTR